MKIRFLKEHKRIIKELLKSGLFHSEQQIIDIALFEWFSKIGFLDIKKVVIDRLEQNKDKQAIKGKEMGK